MVDPATILAGAGAVAGLVRRRRRPNIRGAIAELRASRPTGYTTDADLRAAELTKGRISEGARRQGQLDTYEVQRRSRARGLAGSPSEERTLGRVGQQTALGIQRAGEAAEEQLYNTSMGREAFERQKAFDIFRAQVGDVQREQIRQDAQQGAFWNSLNEFLPSIMSYLPAAGAAASTVTPGPTQGGGFNPGGGNPRYRRIEQVPF